MLGHKKFDPDQEIDDKLYNDYTPLDIAHVKIAKEEVEDKWNLK